MWALILISYALVFLALIATTALVATLTADHRRGTRAHTVLKTLFSATLGASGLLVLLVRLHDSGLF